MKGTTYSCWRPDYGTLDDGREISARDARSAAELYAAKLCSLDPDCYQTFDSGCEVRVRDLSGNDFAFEVFMHNNPVFNARTKKH